MKVAISRYCALLSGDISAKCGREALKHALGRLRFACGPREELRIQQVEAARRVRKAKPVAVEGIVDVEQAAAVEGGQEAARPGRVGGQELVEPLEQQRPQNRRRLAGPEPAQLVLAEDVVAGEQLVRALSREDDV